MNKTELIEIITQKVVQKLKETQYESSIISNSDNDNKKVLILINHTDRKKELIAQLEELDDIKTNLNFIFYFVDSPAKEKFFESHAVLSNLPETEEFIRKFDLIFLDQLDITQLSKLANLQADSPIEKIIQKSVLLKKPVVIAVDKIKKLLPINFKLPNTLRDKIQSYLSALESFEINLIELKELKKTIEEKLIKKDIFNYPSRPVVTKDDIISAYQLGYKKIELPKGAIITSSARDEAKRYEIEIIE